MRVPVSWLRELVDIPSDADAQTIGDALVRMGLELEEIHLVGGATGPVVVGRVLSFEDEPQKNGKTIRWCTVDVGPDHGGERGIVCGASNFAVGDLVVVALPGAELPGGFAISARKTYGHVSDGMICSSRELGLGDDHDGIMILDPAAPIGADALEVLGARDEVLEFAVTPDRGYCFSMRGFAREAALAFGVAFHDPANVPGRDGVDEASAHEVAIEDATGADRITLRTLAGFDPAAPSPEWMQRRLTMSGMRPLSLAVDVTNYVMLETGQPLHAFDRAQLNGPIRVRRAVAGEKLTTLDGVDRVLVAEDLVIADDSGAIALAGTMGGASTEVTGTTTEIVLEAAHFDPVVVARQARRHKLPSEASRRFEREVDPALGAAASARAAALLAQFGQAHIVGSRQVDHHVATGAIAYPVERAGRTAGCEIPADVVIQSLTDVGCAIDMTDDGRLSITPPSWRPDLTDPADLDEEVIRLVGYDTVPSRLPRLPSGRGYTPQQRLRSSVSRALAEAGFTEALAYPFVGVHELDALGLPADDARRRAVRLANPMSDEQPDLRTTLLPGILANARRNVGRGAGDVALFEIGAVYRWPADRVAPSPDAVPRPSVAQRPSDAELASLEALLPDEHRRVAVVMAGHIERSGWWGTGREATWSDAIDAARLVADICSVELIVTADRHEPWHPGRCAALHIEVDGERVLVGHAGELHPKVLENVGLPARTVAAELNLDALVGAAASVVPAPSVSTYPVAKEDVAVVVRADVPVAAVEAALREGAGELLESIRLFDTYTGPQIGEGNRSLAFALRFRAPDRTLAVDEVSAARDAAVAAASDRLGATLRS
jgi:phenylalanyl-tRNA synthetase beta chain